MAVTSRAGRIGGFRAVGRMRARTVVAVVVTAAVLGGVVGCADDEGGGGPAPAPAPAPAGACPATVEAAAFPSVDELHALLVEWNSFGLRSPGSDAHEAALDWLAAELAAVDGMVVEEDEYRIDRWQPTPVSSAETPQGTPSRDLAAAGALTVGPDGAAEEIPLIGAVPFTAPTATGGTTAPLRYLGPDEAITPETAGGRIIVRELPHTSLPYAAFELIAHHLTDDMPTEGDYDRPYLRRIDEILIEAGIAGAAGVVLVWDAPTDQLRGYWDPHTGTRFHVPAVYAGVDQLESLRALADAGAPATMAVRASWDTAPTRNLIATLPGASRERIVVNSNTDSVTWVQENGVVAAIALARYLGGLPERCRPRDVQFALTTNHLGFTTDGTFRYGPELDRGYDAGTVAFVMALEHLGSREILPSDGDGRLELTGLGEVFAWSAPAESPALVEASVEAVTRRGLDRTVVLEGVGVPGEQVPAICSQGGLGTNFHGLLIPTIAGISGPWSLWAPSFGEEAVDVDRLRDQTLAFGDVLLALDDVDRDTIAGDYTDARRRRAEGAATCDLTPPPAVAPTG